MENSFHDQFKKKQVPGNYEKKRLDRTYQIASSTFDTFPPNDSALQKLMQSEASENDEIQAELTNLLFKSHYFDLSFKTKTNQNSESLTRRNSLNLSSSSSIAPNMTQKNKRLSKNSFYDFYKEYGSSFMTKTSNSKSNEYKYTYSNPV